MIKQARYYWLLLTEGHLRQSLSGRCCGACGAVRISRVAEAIVAATSGQNGAGDGAVSEELAGRAAGRVLGFSEKPERFLLGLPGRGLD